MAPSRNVQFWKRWIKENSQRTLGFFKYLFNLMYLDAPHNVTVSVLPSLFRALCVHAFASRQTSDPPSYIAMGRTNVKVKVFSTRNSSPHESRLMQNVFEQLEEELYKKVDLLQPTPPTLSKSFPAPRNFFDRDPERAMNNLDTRERQNLNLPIVLGQHLELASEHESAPCPRARRTGTSTPTCLDSHVVIATKKPWAPDQQALIALSIDLTLSGHNQVTADEALHCLNEGGTGAQDTPDPEQRQRHAKLPIEASRTPRMLCHPSRCFNWQLEMLHLTA